jgi:hypothetical protein
MGGGSGQLPADTTEWTGTVPCQEEFEFTVVALDAADGEIGRASVDGTTQPCPSFVDLYGEPQVITGAPMEVPPGELYRTAATCPDGMAAIGGGFSAGGDLGHEPRGWMRGSVANDDGRSWGITVEAPPDRVGFAQPYVVCLAGAETVKVRESAWVGEGSTGSVSVQCPPDTMVTGGGWGLDSDGADIRSSVRDGNGWQATASGTEAGSGLVVAAVCLDFEYGSASTVEGSGSAEEGAVGWAMAGPCRASNLMTGGGFRLHGGVAHSAHPSGDQWRISVWNPAGTGGSATFVSEAVCAWGGPVIRE